MAKTKIYSITIPEYQFDPAEFPPTNGYLIVGEKDGKAVLNHFGENVMPHMKAIEWYKEQNFPAVCVFTNGRILALAHLKNQLNQQPIDEVIGQLERELLG